MEKKFVIVLSLMVVVIIMLSVWCFFLAKEANSQKVLLRDQEACGKAVVFARLFVDKVLLSSGTINFDDRLELENAVRAVNDQEVFSEWQKFTVSKNDGEAQKIVGNMLKLIIDKIAPK